MSNEPGTSAPCTGDEDFEALILRYLDGCAEPAEIAALEGQLRADPGRRQRFARLARQHGRVAELLKSEERADPAPAAATPRAPVSSLRRSTFARSRDARPRRTAAGAAAAIAALAAIVVAIALRAADTPSATIQRLSGSVLILRPDAAGHAAPLSAATTGARLRASDILACDDGASAEISFGDGTTVALAGGSWLRLGEVDPAATGIVLELERGSFSAKVAHQPPGHPLVATTDTAVVTVLGTQFTLSRDSAAARLEVTAGTVRFASRTATDGSASIEVTAGEQATVAADGRIERHTRDAAVSTDHRAPTRAARGTGSGLIGDYYDSLEFRDYRFSRLDPQVAFDWGAAPPDPRLHAETFSIRWSGEIEAEFSEDYIFSVLVDDGARLRVDGRLLIDEWHRNEPTEFQGFIHLEAGRRYPIVLEYYQDPHVAQVWLRWESLSQPKQVVPTERLYPTIRSGVPRPRP